MSGEIFKNDEDLEKAGYMGVASERVADSMTRAHRLALFGLLSEAVDFGAGYRLFVSPDRKEAIVVPAKPSWENQLNVISFRLDKPLTI